MSDILDSLLSGDLNPEDFGDPTHIEEETGVSLPYLVVVQNTSSGARKAIKDGPNGEDAMWSMLRASGRKANELVNDPDSSWEKEYDEIPVMLIDMLQVPHGRGKRTARQFWPMDDQIKCSSQNGVVPDLYFIGKTVTDPRNQTPIVIGEAARDEDSADVCRHCPLSNWIRPEDGQFSREHAPPCNQTPKMVLWSPGMGLFVLAGNSLAIRKSLFESGDKFGRKYPRQDGSTNWTALPENWHVATGTVSVEIDQEFFGKMKDAGQISSADEKRIDKEGTHAVLSTYAWAPEGKPLEVFKYTGKLSNAYPLVIKATRKEVTSDRLVFGVDNLPSEEPLTEEEFAEYLKARLDYTEEETRKNLMRLGQLDEVEALLTSGEIAVDDGRQLASGKTDVVQAEIINDDDDDLGDVPF